MKRYDPERAPDPAVWLAMDEAERIALVEAYHRRANIRLPNRRLHDAMHALVENQLMERIAVVQETLERLMREGLGRHDAIHAIGSVVVEGLWHAMNRTPRVPGDERWYPRRLETLTARAWLENGG